MSKPVATSIPELLANLDSARLGEVADSVDALAEELFPEVINYGDRNVLRHAVAILREVSR